MPKIILISHKRQIYYGVTWMAFANSSTSCPCSACLVRPAVAGADGGVFPHGAACLVLPSRGHGPTAGPTGSASQSLGASPATSILGKVGEDSLYVLFYPSCVIVVTCMTGI